IHREVKFAGLDAALFFVDGFAKDDVMTLILRSLSKVSPDDIKVRDKTTLQEIFLKYINYIEVGKETDLNQVVEQVLAGPLALLVDGEEEAIILDVREYPGRSPEEPDLEKVVRGSRDGFTETLVFNTTLIRRRLRDPQLRFEIMQAGRRSKTDIAIAYIKDIANPELVDSIKNRIQNIEIDALPMAEKAVEELITPGSYWNPYPKVRFTERPDVAAVHLTEGHVLVLVDTSPSIIITPSTFFHHLQHAEEYRQNPTVGVYTRWVRFVGILLSIFVLPLWFLGSIEPQILPESLKFIGPEKTGPIPLFIQFLMAEVAIDFIRLATIHVPAPLATAAGVIAAVLIGDLAASIGFFIPEVILYTAIAAIGTFLTPSVEIAMANRLVRLLLLVLAATFKLPGLIVGSILVVLFLATAKSFGIPYLWPLIPLNIKALGNILVRSPVPVGNIRPSALKPIDRTSQRVTRTSEVDQTKGDEVPEELVDEPKRKIIKPKKLI
ncbi:MAG TPA: spore germination protein, partial [Clostridia bacterium]|nr:spore germination protein [Clostridia bacterium]